MFFLPFVEKEHEGLMSVFLGMMWISVVGLNRGKVTVRQEDIKPTHVAWWDFVPRVVDSRRRNTEKTLTGCLDIHRMSEQSLWCWHR